ncbi:single-stranded DNA-binding protein [Mycobacterium sp. NPDC051804]|uniref:single-stranded DNA-binding protein n=1 Tax=Mycobacterium sp. NPDC051804 TaxID=3364295 RepID=UPI0037A67172
MFETPFHIVGNIVTDPIHRQVGEQEMVRFRVASNSRRRTAEGTWEPGNSLFVTVTCWGRAVAGASAGLVKGDPVIVVGHIYTSEYEDRDGNRRSSVEVRASSVGPDLARCTARIDRGKQPADAQVTSLAEDAADFSDDDDAGPSGKALPLSA